MPDPTPPPVETDAGAQRTFPIIGYGRVPYHLAEQAYRTYAARWGSSQTLERLGERGGFHPVEFTDFLFNRRTPNGDSDREKQAEALIEIAAVVERCCPQRVERLEQEHAAILARLATAEAENGRLKAEREHLLSLVRSSLRLHGLCQPRERKACTACNAADELREIVKAWGGLRVHLAALAGDAEKGGGGAMKISTRRRIGRTLLDGAQWVLWGWLILPLMLLHIILRAIGDACEWFNRRVPLNPYDPFDQSLPAIGNTYEWLGRKLIRALRLDEEEPADA
jgi:hypothetical protein